MTQSYRVHDRASAILEYWFQSLDDEARLEPASEPFKTCYARWYGKDLSIDAEIRHLFEGDLQTVTAAGGEWISIIDAWAAVPGGLLALTILLDQFPRNMYRGTVGMYEYDPLALVVATRAVSEAGGGTRSLVRQLFQNVPFMHIENLTIQQFMLGQFRSLAALAETRSPHNVQFFRFALRYAERHADVIQKYGRFPHRNSILGRTATPAEVEYMQGEDPGF
ncbi:MAG TPA: DUF924 family protein [Polyangiaceae bacterium]